MIANLKFPGVEEGLKVISVANTKIILHRDGFPSLSDGYDIMKIL